MKFFSLTIIAKVLDKASICCFPYKSHFKPLYGIFSHAGGLTPIHPPKRRGGRSTPLCAPSQVSCPWQISNPHIRSNQWAYAYCACMGSVVLQIGSCYCRVDMQAGEKQGVNVDPLHSYFVRQRRPFGRLCSLYEYPFGWQPVLPYAVLVDNHSYHSHLFSRFLRGQLVLYKACASLV